MYSTVVLNRCLVRIRFEGSLKAVTVQKITPQEIDYLMNLCCGGFFLLIFGSAFLKVFVPSAEQRRHKEQMEIDRERNEILRRGVRIKEFEVISRYTDADDDHGLPRPKKNPWLK